MDSGRSCAAPSLRGKRFCYWHNRLRQDFKLPGTPGYQPPLLESPNSVVVALNHVFLAQSRGLIDERAARHLQWTLRLALQSFRLLDSPTPAEVVTDPPDFGANFGPGNAIDAAPTGDKRPQPPIPPATPRAPFSKSAEAASGHLPAPEPKRGIWDPEGCLSHFSKTG